MLAATAIGSAAGFGPIDFDVIGIEALCFWAAQHPMENWICHD